MSWLDAVAYGPSERANGMRLPATTATRRGLSLRSLIGWLSLGWALTHQ
ncbi:hypothetical protein M2266_004143 [Streptomyces sp. SPB162]|nr:hypothetical protein [Streptomyces sp. SPB162]